MTPDEFKAFWLNPQDDDRSLAEQAAEFTPPLYETPPHPDTVTPLRGDEGLPVVLSRAEQLLVDTLAKHPECKHGDKCSLVDYETRAGVVAHAAVEAFSVLMGAAEMLAAHGDNLAAETLILGINRLAEDTLRPYLIGAGLMGPGEDPITVRDDDDD